MIIHSAKNNDMDILAWNHKGDKLTMIRFKDNDLIRQYLIDKDGLCVSQKIYNDRNGWIQLGDDFYPEENGARIDYIPFVFLD